MTYDNEGADLPTSAGFLGGTLVATQNGLRRIDEIKIGDLVLVSADRENPNSYRPVSKLGRAKNAPMVSVRFSIKLNDDFHNERIVLAGLPLFLVDGFDPDVPEKYKERFRQKLGWQEIRDVESGLLVSTVTGNLADLWKIDQIWQTGQANVGWIEVGRDSGSGHLIKFHNGCVVEEKKDPAILDLGCSNDLIDDDFVCRYETEEMALYYAYKDTAYSIETEDGRPVVVGHGGLLIHPGKVSEAFYVWAHERIWA